MHRIDHNTKDVDLFGSGKHGFTEGSPGTEAATVVTDDWLNGVQEEICNVIEDASIALVKGTRDQLLDAIRFLVANNGGVIPITSGYGTDAAGANEWSMASNSMVLGSEVDLAIIAFGVNLPKGIQQDTVFTIYVKPGAARTGSNKMSAGLYQKNTTGGTATLVGSLVYDDGTTSGQNLVVTNSAITPTADYSYYLFITAGNTAAASQDLIYSILQEITPS